MEAKELRIGNFINEKFWNRQKRRFDFEMIEVKDVLSSHLVDKDDTAYNYEEVKPIRLNESWLINFGFERTYFGRKLNGFYLEASSRIVKTDELCSFKYEQVPDEKYIDVSYVHELQNLFFAITRTELELKDKVSV